MSFAIPRTRIIAVVIAVALALTTIGFTVGVRAAGHDTPVVFVASGESFPDGLGSGPAAALNRGPVLLVRQNSIPAATAAELTRLTPDRIVVVGGPAAVSNAVETQLAAYAPDVDRIGGSDRYGTAAEVSQEFFPATLPAGPPGPPGPAGPQGPAGPEGPPGISGYEVKAVYADAQRVERNELFSLIVDCGSKMPISGGHRTPPAASLRLELSYPGRSNPNSWVVAWRNYASRALTGDFEAYAVCATVAP